MKNTLTYGIVFVLMAGALASCGRGVSGLLGGPQNTASKPATKADHLARSIQVAWTSARASRCGFYFNANELRSSYLAYEAGQGATGADIKKYREAYDFTYKTTSKKMRAKPDYCKEKKKVEEIRADLQRHLQGDYTARPRKKSSDT